MAKENDDPYLQAWLALSKMLVEGKSYSGREANVTYLGTGNDSKGVPTFANVSGISGFGTKDDARSVLASDFDGDGDLDIWMNARTTPAVRYLENTSTPAVAKRSLQFALIGAEGRSAIGAKIELLVQGKEREYTASRSVQAGGSFLGQSSGWQHFGFGAGDQLVGARIIWPDGQVQSIKGLKFGGRYICRQGEKPQELVKFKPIEFSRARTGIARSKYHRTFPLKLPAELEKSERATVLVLETTEESLTKDRELIAGLERQASKAFVVQLGDGWEGQATWQLDEDELMTLDLFSRSLTVVQPPLQAPFAFGIRDGRCVAWQRDGISSTLGFEQRLFHDLPKPAILPPGPPRLLPPAGHDPLPLAKQLLLRGLIDEAKTYLKLALVHGPLEVGGSREGGAQHRDLATVQDAWEGIFLKRDQQAELIAQYEELYTELPFASWVLEGLARQLTQARDYPRVIETIAAAAEGGAIKPNSLTLQMFYLACLRMADSSSRFRAMETRQFPAMNAPGVLYLRALCWERERQWDEAAKLYRFAVRQKHMPSRAGLAWILVTHPTDAKRNGKLAMELMQPLAARTEDPNYGKYVRTMAAVFAQVGQMDAAQNILKQYIQQRPEDRIVPTMKEDVEVYAAGETLVLDLPD